MAENITENVVIKMPAVIKRINSEKDYQGFETICAYHMHSNIHIPEKIAQKYSEYKDKSTNCPHEDDSYCMADKCKQEKCPHCVKVGFVQCGEYDRVYPAIGDCLIAICHDALYGTILILPQEEVNYSALKEPSISEVRDE